MKQPADPDRGAAVFDSVPDAVLGVDTGGRVALANAYLADMFGYAREELVGTPIDRLVPDGLPTPGTMTAQLFGVALDVHGRRKDGSEFPAEVSVCPLKTADGLIVAAVVRDITKRKQVEDELRRSQAQLAEAQALARIGSWEWDIPANRVVWSDQLYRIYGLDPGEIEPNYEEFLSRVHPEDRESVDERNRKAFADQQPFEDVKRILRPDGEVFLMRTKGEVIADGDGNPVRMIGVCEDVSEEIRAEEASAALAAIVMTSSDAIVGHTVDGVITSWNPGAERLYGWAAGEAVGRSVDLFLPPGRVEEERRIVEQLRTGERVDDFEAQRLRKDGSVIDVSVSMSAISGPRGSVEAISSIARDVTERRRLEQQLRYLADHDALTGLANRRRFEEMLAHQLARTERYGETGAVLVLDLDSFKYVNDTLGHGSGDELLRSVASLLQARMRDTDTVARLGGDEFAVLAAHADARDAHTVAVELLDAVRANALVTQGNTIRVTASVGAATFEAPALHGDDLLAAANRAMHTAKDLGRDRVELHTPERWRKAGQLARQSWEHRIRQALEQDLFELHCQPILDFSTGGVSQYELLLRLADKDNLVPPGAFLGVAERLGLIRAIDRWVVRQAIALLADHGRGGRELKLEVNLSGQSIGDPELIALIGREVAAAGVDPRCLIFEITETAAIANIDEARRFASELTAAGCSFALDDFGAGFGSFYYLKHLPAEYLKIDGDFVQSPRSRTDELIVESIVQVARGLGKRTIAEFVSDEETMRQMRHFGVDLAQGYHVGRPFSVADLPARFGEGPTP